MAYDATGISLEGFPSHLETEFLIRKMLKNGLLREPVHLFSVVDYDPSGYWIQKKLADQLKGYDVKIGSIHALISPTELSKEKLAFHKYKLRESGKTSNWLNLTDGINGEAYGLEADAFGGKLIRKVFDKAVQPYLDKGNQRLAFDNKRETFFQRLAVDSIYEKTVHNDVNKFNFYV